VYLVIACLVCLSSSLRGQERVVSELQQLGFAADRFSDLEALVQQGIDANQMPGCVICVGRRSKIAYLKAFGERQVAPEPEAMTTDTVFDMASITKPVATATSIMSLVERGQIRLQDKVTRFFPEFGTHGKEAITIQDLLIHQSGLIPDNALADYELGPEIAWQKICDLKLVADVGTTFKYSDVNFVVLGKIVEAVSNLNLHDYSQSNIFIPLGMQETGYVPAEALRSRAAPTERRNDEWMRGEVHDPRAYLLGGIAGHAGLFSTATDIAKYAQMMLSRGSIHPSISSATPSKIKRILSPQTIDLMTRGFPVSSGLRGLGWDKQTGFSTNRGDLLTEAAFGHGGFTGTVLWIDPRLDLFFIFLSNRVHPDGKGSVNSLAGQILNVVVSSLQSTASDNIPRSTVLCGIDVLERDQFRLLEGQRVGLITNHTGRTRTGKSSVAVLNDAEQVKLTTLFSPEHGFEGRLDVPTIADSADPATGLTVHSLYGKTRRPTAEMLENVDTIVFDIQDIGTRFYTYISTMGEAMFAAAEHGKKFVILDRPNPINGVTVTGPMLDAGKESFVGFHSLPVRHGMTSGEIARMLKAERKLELSLEVVPCEGWQRSQTWDHTDLVWINPSPNMRNINQAILYPGIGLLEMTNVSVGRGTDTPFELIGSSWMDGRAVTQRLKDQYIPGVAFVPIEFQPTSGPFANELCGGFQILITDRNQLQPVRLGLEIAAILREVYPEQWQTKNLNRLLGNDRVAECIVDGLGIQTALDRTQDGIAEFIARRKTFLLY
jgi:uncharacterized protein YbbC (DUF1343 family)